MGASQHQDATIPPDTSEYRTVSGRVTCTFLPPKLANKFLFISTLHQNHLHKDSWLQLLLLVGLLLHFGAETQKTSNWCNMKTPKIIIIIVVLEPNSGPDSSCTGSCLIGSIWRSQLKGSLKRVFFYGDGVVSPNPQPEGPGYLSLSDTLLKPVRREWPYQQLGCHQQGIQDIKTVKVQCMNSVPVRALSHSSDRLPFCCSVYFASQSA